MNALGIVTALAAEAHALGAATRHRDAALSRIDGHLVAVSGIGYAAATLAASRLIDAGATALVSFGMAGGLDPSLRAGTVVLPSEVICTQGARFITAREWRERLSAAIVRHRPVVGGTLLNSRQALDSVAEKAAAFEATGATAVDMESVAVATLAAAHHLPFIAVRVIVDTAADVLPRSVMAASRTGRVRLWRLLGALALAPAELAPLLRLGLRYRAAMGSLAVVGRGGLLSPGLWAEVAASRCA